LNVLVPFMVFLQLPTRKIKGLAKGILVRDEGVAGSNPATPTKYPLATLNFHNYRQRLPISKRRA
jgi:hypothetical protein